MSLSQRAWLGTGWESLLQPEPLEGMDKSPRERWRRHKGEIDLAQVARIRPARLNSMEATTTQRYIHTSPRKLRLVADMVRSMDPSKALEVLYFTKKAAASDLSTAIKSALSSAKQKGMDNVVFKRIEINEGPRMKRLRAASRGRVRPYKRRMAHIKIVLSDELVVRSKNKKEKEQIASQKGVMADSAVKPESTAEVTSESAK